VTATACAGGGLSGRFAGGVISPIARGSRLSAATIFSPSFSRKNR